MNVGQNKGTKGVGGKPIKAPTKSNQHNGNYSCRVVVAGERPYIIETMHSYTLLM